MKKILFDCDNTLGQQGRDVDDALALFYLLGSAVELLGVTTTHGNDQLEVVYQRTKELLSVIQKPIPLAKGALSAQQISRATLQLLWHGKAHQKRMNILATGALTNIASAIHQKPDYLQQVGELVVMGGITEPLYVGDKVMKELNFSVDPKAAQKVLTAQGKMSVITGNNCLKGFFSKEELLRHLGDGYLMEQIDYWLTYYEKQFGLSGFYNWDTVAAAYMVDPQFFQDHWADYSLEEKELEEGRLVRKSQGHPLNLPTIKDETKFKKVALKRIKQGLQWVAGN